MARRIQEYQEYKTKDYKDRNKKVLKPEEITAIPEVIEKFNEAKKDLQFLGKENADKTMEVYKTLGNCNFEGIGADMAKLEIISIVIITNSFPLIMRDLVNKEKAIKEVFKLVSKWYISGDRKYLVLSVSIVELLTPLDVLQLKP